MAVLGVFAAPTHLRQLQSLEEFAQFIIVQVLRTQLTPADLILVTAAIMCGFFVHYVNSLRCFSRPKCGYLIVLTSDMCENALIPHYIMAFVLDSIPSPHCLQWQLELHLFCQGPSQV